MNDLFNHEVQRQFRMARLQVFNWGTFSGLHDIAISRKGFLFTGRSGSGKTTLLDAISTLLTQSRWLQYNAAAQPAERRGRKRDRDFMSYVRGAWAEGKHEDSNDSRVHYLRGHSTWSALALTYEDGAGGTVVLARIFWVNGSGRAAQDVKQHFFIFERPFDLHEMKFFGDDFNVRKLKKTFADDFSTGDFAPYCRRFMGLLKIDSEHALKLLHKTQSAKNLGDLNTFLRDYMLDEPDTFERAEKLVEEFVELREAHQSVVTAREQIGVLQPARTAHEEQERLLRQNTKLEALLTVTEAFHQQRRVGLLDIELMALKTKLQHADGEVRALEEDKKFQDKLLEDLRLQYAGAGGAQITQWETNKQHLEDDRQRRLAAREKLRGHCAGLGWELPQSAEELASWSAAAEAELKEWDTAHEKNQNLAVNLLEEKKAVKKALADDEEQIEYMRNRRSNIPVQVARMRGEIARALNVSEAALPFAGELLQVKDDEAEWNGVIERVLRGFAISLLVEDKHYSRVVDYVNENNLRGKLVYHKINPFETPAVRPLTLNSMAGKLEVKGGTFTAWLKAELARHDYACVETTEEFRRCERAVTKEGSVRHSKTRHEKDDRRKILDSSEWVLGFDSAEKIKIFGERVKEHRVKIQELDSQLGGMGNKEKDLNNRRVHCHGVTGARWNEIDVASVLPHISELQRLIDSARSGNNQLQNLHDRITAQEKVARNADTRLSDAKLRRDKVADKIADYQRERDGLAAKPPLTLMPDQQTELDARLSARGKEPTLKNIEGLIGEINTDIRREQTTVMVSAAGQESTICKQFAEYVRCWKFDAGDLRAELECMGEFLQKLERLEQDGLPKHEQRFFALLNEHSTQNLILLTNSIRDARKDILERMEQVNASLAKSEFNQGTYLKITVQDLKSDEVAEFMREIREVMSNAWTEDRDVAERRFLFLKQLVERLGSAETQHEKWRKLVLDVRQHVEFHGEEFFKASHELVEVYRSGSGKSGGQLQKLTTTCLAAALSYQLGNSEHGAPLYGAVVLDEAFDKTDNEFTDLALNVFVNFGFQMIVATPLKSVMTLEPFIGGACFVEIADRKKSGVLMIEYDETPQKLKLSEQLRHEMETDREDA